MPFNYLCSVLLMMTCSIIPLIPGLLAGAQVQNCTIRSNPHNNAQSEKIRKKSHTVRKFLLEILIKMGISIEYQDFSNIFRLFSEYLHWKATRRLRYPNNKAFLDIHDVLRGLLGLMGRSRRVFSFSCFD